jgi:hypothetical protein
MIALANRYPNAKVSLICHSFGTYLLAKSFENLSVYNSPTFDKVILCGSVLKVEYDWQNEVDKFSLGMIVNDCGISDFALLISDIFAPGFGKGGRNGFNNTIANTIKNRYFKGGHGCFFKPNHIKDWIEILETGKVVDVDQRNEIGLVKILQKGLARYKYLSIALLISIISYFLYV